MSKFGKKLNISYARYLKSKRADRYVESDELSYAEKHSQRVASTKKFLLRMVVLLIILLIVWPLANKDWSSSKLSFQSESASEKESENKNNAPVMLSPNFFGNDDNGQPFNINADSGVSISEEKTVLNNIKADMTLKDNSKVKLSSSKGDYSSSKKTLALTEGVVIHTDSGYDLETNSAYVKLNENMATGTEEVNMSGRLGDIDAKGFTILNSGDEIILFGGVNLQAYIDNKDIKKLQSIETTGDAQTPAKN